MSKFTTVIHHNGVPGNGILVPGQTIREVSAALELCRLSGTSYEILDADENAKGVAMIIPSWQIPNIVVISRVDLVEMKRQMERLQTQQKLGVAPS